MFEFEHRRYVDEILMKMTYFMTAKTVYMRF